MGDLDDIADAVQQPKRVAGAETVQPSARQFGTDRIWTVHDRGRQFGPHTEVEIAVLVGSGEVSHEALVWREGSPRWIPVSNIVPLPQRVATAPPPVPVIVNIHNVNSVAAAPARVGNSWGTASLVLAIIAILFICIPFVSFPFAISSLILGIIGVAVASGSRKPTGSATAGIVLSLLMLLLSALVVAGILSAGSMHAPPRPTWSNSP